MCVCATVVSGEGTIILTFPSFFWLLQNMLAYFFARIFFQKIIFLNLILQTKRIPHHEAHRGFTKPQES